jgi:hypothetical protein
MANHANQAQDVYSWIRQHGWNGPHQLLDAFQKRFHLCSHVRGNTTGDDDNNGDDDLETRAIRYASTIFGVDASLLDKEGRFVSNEDVSEYAHTYVACHPDTHVSNAQLVEALQITTHKRLDCSDMSLVANMVEKVLNRDMANAYRNSNDE